MSTKIKYFREDFKDLQHGTPMEKVQAGLDKCEAVMLKRFDEWKAAQERKGFKIISAIPKRLASYDLFGDHLVSLTVLYEDGESK